MGRIVKYNLKKCDRILVAQPTILDIAKKFNETAEYLPIPFDPEIFFPKPLLTEKRNKVVFMASTHDFKTKGTDKFLRALALLPNLDSVRIRSIASGKDFLKAQELAKKLNLNVEFIGRVHHNKMSELYWESDLVLGSYGVGQLDTVAIEAMACGRPVVHSISKNFFSTCPLEELQSLDEAAKIIYGLLTERWECEKRVKSQLLYVNSTHFAPLVVNKLMEVYSELQKKNVR